MKDIELALSLRREARRNIKVLAFASSASFLSDQFPHVFPRELSVVPIAALEGFALLLDLCIVRCDVLCLGRRGEASRELDVVPITALGGFGFSGDRYVITFEGKVYKASGLSTSNVGEVCLWVRLCNASVCEISCECV